MSNCVLTEVKMDCETQLGKWKVKPCFIRAAMPPFAQAKDTLGFQNWKNTPEETDR